MSQPAERSWLALVALAVVAVLTLMMCAIDIAIDRNTAHHTDSLVDNSLRSVALADDLRYQAYRLSIANLTADQIASIAEQIDADAKAYAPLTNSEGEAEEFHRLQALLDRMRKAQPLTDPGHSETMISEVETSIARLVRINQDEARTSADMVANVHQRGLVLEAIVGSITLAAVALVAFILVRSLRRQRALLKDYLNSVEERTRELAAFAGRTAHDLKGPLSPIRGYADLLSLQPSADVKEMARRIGRSVDRMSGIIDDMLELSVHGRPVGGKVALTPVVLEAIEELRAELGDVEVSLELGDLVVACSGSMLGQVVRNLVSNASKYRAAERRLALRVHARRIDDRIEVSVSDNGRGMDADAASHAFEPLYRASTDVPGHGLGLSIVRRTVEAIGGTVELESKPGQGTSVTLVLPAAA